MDKNLPDETNAQDGMNQNPSPAPPGMRSAADEPDSLPGDTRGCTVAILVAVLVTLILLAVLIYLLLKPVFG